MAKKKKLKEPVVGAYNYNPYMPSSIKAGMKKPAEPKPIKVLAEEIPPRKWLGILIVSLIPLINLIAFLAWGNKNNYGTNPNVKTFAKAAFVLYLILYILLGASAAVLKFVLHLF